MLFDIEEASPRFSAIGKENTPFVGFKNIEQLSDHSLEENLDFLRCLKKDFPSKIIIASIMGQNEDEWASLAGKMEEVGDDIIDAISPARRWWARGSVRMSAQIPSS